MVDVPRATRKLATSFGVYLPRHLRSAGTADVELLRKNGTTRIMQLRRHLYSRITPIKYTKTSMSHESDW